MDSVILVISYHADVPLSVRMFNYKTLLKRGVMTCFVRL